ncbi:MAG: hypothetical protein HY828_05800 [Actinobacteria bacterium]|nr:hypothetical protein [Actinomycetota bacterium]
MQAASASGASGGGGNRQMKRWGPIIGVVVVVLIGGGVLLATRGDDDDDSAGGDTTAAAVETTAAAGGGSDTTAAGTDTTVAAGGEITFPMSWTQAEEAGLTDQIEWGDRCDTTTGRIAVPDFFRSECFAPFTGDNGGATSTGVTADEITIVYYEGPDADPVISYITDAIAVDDTNAQQFETMQNIVKYYEAYYELYGRTINLVTYEGTGIATDEVAARADAAAIVEKYQPFAVIGGPALTSAFADELALNKTLCIGCTPGQPPEFYTDRDPYVWGLDGSAIQKQTHVLEFIEKQLIGKNAEHAGEALQATPRTFGLVYLESSGASKDLADRFAAGMQALGAPLAETVAYQLDPATIQQQASQVITKLKAAGVTTVVFSGDPVAPRDFTKEATAQEYFPEWVVAASTLVDVTAFARTYDPQQWSHAFGVTQLAARGNPVTTGSYANYEWFNGAPPPADDTIGVISPNPALLFAVLQGMGPNVTAESFRDALFASDATVRAISQPSLSYGDKGIWEGVTDYQGVDDATVFWWDPAATGPDEIRKEGTGMYQYVGGGARFLPGEWPTEDKLFVADGAVALYETPPAGEERGDYPSPAG